MMDRSGKITFTMKADPAKLEAFFTAARAANNHLALDDGCSVRRQDDGSIHFEHQGYWVEMSEQTAINLAEFILFGKKNTTLTFEHEGVPITAVVLQGDLEKHQLARLAKLEDEGGA